MDGAGDTKDRSPARTARHICFDDPTCGGRAGETAPHPLTPPRWRVANLIAPAPRWGWGYLSDRRSGSRRRAAPFCGTLPGGGWSREAPRLPEREGTRFGGGRIAPVMAQSVSVAWATGAAYRRHTRTAAPARRTAPAPVGERTW